MNHCCDQMDKTVGGEGARLSFDPIYDEYELAVLDDYWMLLKYCPFCGVKLRESKRGEYFPNVSEEEQTRLLLQVEDCATRADLSAKLGEPEKSFPKSEGFDRIWQQTISFPSSALYTKLSETAELRITFDDEGRITSKTVASRCTRV